MLEAFDARFGGVTATGSQGRCECRLGGVDSQPGPSIATWVEYVRDRTVSQLAGAIAS